MRNFLMIIYTALALGANPLHADPAALRDGDMKKLTIHSNNVAIPAVELLDMDDQPVSLALYQGKWVVLNFWATWCAPCRAEMPSLDRLQAEMPDLAVVPVATGRNDLAAIRRFFGEIGVQHLTTLRDPKSALAREMSVMGLPVTVILNPEGQEVARLIGDAEWDSASAKAVLAAMAGQ